MEQRDPFTETVIGAAIEVHRELGPGLLESVYQHCMGRELFLRGLDFVPKSKVPITYKGERIYDHELEIDFYFAGKMVLELKAVEKLIPVHEAQLLTYMKLTKVRLGLLINFNVKLLKDGIKRMIL